MVAVGRNYTSLHNKKYMQYTYKRNIKAPSRTHCWEGKAAVLGILSVRLQPYQHAKRMRHIVVCGLSVSTIFSHAIS
jgi:hypothetical protein